ncbi:MAG TPA: hypothetical protein VM511_03610 [Luteolibacter sp.]|nr:hypothetical protein [Luteolibacter sp.]
MKFFLIAVIVADVTCCAWALLRTPIIKFNTASAVAYIEAKHLRPDLSVEDRQDFERMKRWILSNERATSKSQSEYRSAMLILGGTLLVQNVLLLAHLRARRAPNTGQLEKR